MRLLNNPLTHMFLDDMADVGIAKWVGFTVFAAVVTYGLWDTSVIPFFNVIGAIMTANLAFAATVTVWWEYHGREKYAGTSILDMAEQLGRDL